MLYVYTKSCYSVHTYVCMYYDDNDDDDPPRCFLLCNNITKRRIVVDALCIHMKKLCVVATPAAAQHISIACTFDIQTQEQNILGQHSQSTLCTMAHSGARTLSPLSDLLYVIIIICFVAPSNCIWTQTHTSPISYTNCAGTKFHPLNVWIVYSSFEEGCMCVSGATVLRSYGSSASLTIYIYYYYFLKLKSLSQTQN